NERPFLMEQPLDQWSAADRRLWEARRNAAAAGDVLALLETPVAKRRWVGARGVFASKVATYSERAIDAARAWVGDWLELHLAAEVQPAGARQFAASMDERALAGCRFAAPGQDPIDCLEAALASEAVPFLAFIYLTEDGLEKNRQWVRCWEGQRKED